MVMEEEVRLVRCMWCSYCKDDCYGSEKCFVGIEVNEFTGKYSGHTVEVGKFNNDGKCPHYIDGAWISIGLAIPRLIKWIIKIIGTLIKGILKWLKRKW